MKLFALLMFSSVCCTNVQGGNVNGGLLERLVCGLAKVIPCSPLRNSSLDVSKIKVHFYDIKQSSSYYRAESYPIEKAAKGILSFHNLNKHYKFFMYVGGYRSHIDSNATKLMRNVLKNIDSSYLLIVDHSAYTHSRDGCTSYMRSVDHVPSIGKKLAEMLADLKIGGILPRNIHGIGHSLGSHILGYVGENFIALTGQKISRITALDPAGPCFKKQSEHVRSGLANHVEIYHCNARVLGSELAVGDVDFFANNGTSQPQCLRRDDWLGVAKCSHSICVDLWVASVQQRRWYPAYNCKEYADFIGDKCYQNHNTTAGFWNPGTATGTYYFSTFNTFNTSLY